MANVRPKTQNDLHLEIIETTPGSKPALTALVFLEFVAVFCAIFTVAMVVLT